jgi:phosphoketolase
MFGTTTNLRRRPTTERKPVEDGPLSAAELDQLGDFWRAMNYLSVSQTYLLDTPVRPEPLKREHFKPRPLGYWGTTPDRSNRSAAQRAWQIAPVRWASDCRRLTLCKSL